MQINLEFHERGQVMTDFEWLEIKNMSKKLDAIIDLLKDIARMMEENRESER
jgi:hypothetical protein